MNHPRRHLSLEERVNEIVRKRGIIGIVIPILQIIVLNIAILYFGYWLGKIIF